ncbi:MAG: NAD(P)H-dependent oxidoreductase subunit E [Clostridia bacterium]|nr:NAD(P)H-dependent oxidoreductase subunit E [Clostridia bacterium]
MSKIKLTKVAFNGTAEQEKQLRDKLAEIKKMDGALMPALQTAQGIYGYLPIEVQDIVAEELGLRQEEVFGVATFYSQFTLNPQGKKQISVCLGTACYVKGSGEVLEKFKTTLGLDAGECSADGYFSLLATRCVGCCGLAPVLTVNDKVYGKVTVSDVEKIIAENR